MENSAKYERMIKMEETKEQVKKTTARKSSSKKTTTATTKTTTETVDLQAQMQQMMQMMAQQQQMFMSMMQQATSQNTVEVEDEQEVKPKQKARVQKINTQDRGLTKQGLRRKYRNTDIYVQSVFQGSVCYEGKNEMYEWENIGDVVPMTIDDLIAMPTSYLHNPWLTLDDYENDEEVLDDIITCLGLENIYRPLYILTDLEENINKVDLVEFETIINNNRAEGGTLHFDATAIVQNKILTGELDSSSRIGQFERILGRSFNKKK